MYQFHLFDVSNTTRLAVLSGIVSAVETEELIGIHTLELTVESLNQFGEVNLGAYPEDATAPAPLLQTEKYIRIYDDDGDYRSFVIRNIRKQHDGPSLRYAITCEAKKFELLNQVVNVAADYSQISADDFLSIILAGVIDFSLGTNDIPSTILHNVTITKPTVMSALVQLHETWNEISGGTSYRFYPVISEAGVIDILREDNLGVERDCPLSFGHSFSNLTVDKSSPVANRVYISGNGNDLVYSRAKLCYETPTTVMVYSGYSQTYRLDWDGSNDDPIAIDSYIVIYFMFGATWANTSGWFQVNFRIELMSDAGLVLFAYYTKSNEIAYPNPLAFQHLDVYTGNFTNVKMIRITCFGSTTGGGAWISNPYLVLVNIRYDLAPNDYYLEDAASQAIYGVIEHSEQTTDLKAINQIRTIYRVDGGSASTNDEFDATLSGSYSGGLADMFTTTGVVTVSENTNPSCIIHGSKSQYLATSASAAGLIMNGGGLGTLPLLLIGGHSYQFLINVYVVSGSFVVRLTNIYGTTTFFEASSAGIGWVQIASETPFGADDTTGVILRILSAGSGGVTMFVDSIMLCMSAEPKPFCKENSSDALYDDALRILYNNKDQQELYEATALDLARMSIDYADYVFAVGDRLRIMDVQGNLDRTVRVYRRQSDLLDPTNMTLSLASLNVSLVDVIRVAANLPSLRGV